MNDFVVAKILNFIVFVLSEMMSYWLYGDDRWCLVGMEGGEGVRNGIGASDSGREDDMGRSWTPGLVSKVSAPVSGPSPSIVGQYLWRITLMSTKCLNVLFDQEDKNNV
jgi:hypothetical protein